MSLHQREGSPFWQYSFTLNGARFRGSTGETDRRKAEAVEAERRYEEANRRTHKDPWRIRDCFGAYWSEHAKFKRSSMFVFRKLEALSRLLGPDTMIADLTNANILDYRAKRRGEGLQPQSINRDFNCLKAALNHARVMHGQDVPPLAWKRLRAKEPPNRIRFLSRDEFETLLAVSDPELQRIIRFAVATGLRKDNVLSLVWSEVDLSSAMVTVTIKGDKLHTVRLTPPMRAMLTTGSARRGRVFNTTNFRRRWDTAVKDAKLDDFRFHDLRHTFASWARMAGADIADICEALGHSDISVTMRYAHIEPTEHRSAFDRVSDGVWSHSVTHSQAKGLK